MVKVVAICTSPRRKGNSEILVDQFLKGARENGHEVEKIILSKYQIHPCIACEYCRKHDSQCFQKDDANTVIDKIIKADVFVLASPIYFYNVSAQLKIVIDRMFAREYEIRNSDKRKKAYFILTSGTPNKQDITSTVESFRGLLKVLKTVDEGGIIYGLGAFEKGDAISHIAFNEAYQMAREI